MSQKNAVNYITLCLSKANEVAKSIGINNLFYNERYAELLMSSLLGHTFNTEVRGHDAYDENGCPAEYKSINTLTGKGCFQFHWLTLDKIELYREVENVFFSIRNDLAIIEIWKLPMTTLFPELYNKYLAAENKRKVLGQAGILKIKNTDAHKSYSLNALKCKGAELVYTNKMVSYGA